MAKIYLQRHTRVDVEPHICYGVSDVALHPEFESVDLPQVLSRIKDITISKLYSSPLSRCRELAIRIGGQVEVDNRLIELNFGDWEFMEWDDIFNSERGKEWFADYLNRETPNGESFAHMVERAKSFLSEIKSKEQDTMVVTHSGFIRAALVAEQRITLQEAFEFSIEYGELMELSR